MSMLPADAHRRLFSSGVDWFEEDPDQDMNYSHVHLYRGFDLTAAGIWQHDIAPCLLCPPPAPDQEPALCVADETLSWGKHIHIVCCGRCGTRGPWGDSESQALALWNAAHKRNNDVVPGVMHCARCKFRLNRVNLYVNSGTVGAGDNQTEPCPNGCGPLWPVTWEQEAREGYTLAEKLFERAKRAEDALHELVALKDIKDECLRRRQRRPCSVTRIFPQDLLDAEAGYNERKPKAWAAARAVLLGPNAVVTRTQKREPLAE